MKYLILSIFIYLLMCPQLSAQQSPKSPDRLKRNYPNSQTAINKIPNLKSISINPKISSGGDWVEFKNWNETNAVVAENDSIVWVGTSVGLIRWNINNRSYTTFDEKNGLNHTSINSLALDKNKILWITTSTGIVKYSSGIFTVYNFQNSYLPNAPFTHIAIDSLNNIYVGYEWYISNYEWVDGGIAIYNGTTWLYRDIPCGRGTFGPTSICVYHDTVWIGEYDQLYTLKDNSVLPVPGWMGGVRSITVDFEDSLWILSNQNNLQKLRKDGWKIIIDFDIEPFGNSGSNIWNDPRGGLWFSDGSYWYPPEQTMYRLDINMQRLGQTCTPGVPKGICSVPRLNHQFSSQYALHNNVQFFATKWGLLKFTGLFFQSYIIPTTLSSNCIYSLGCSPSGEVYFSAEMITQKTNGISWDSVGENGWIDPEIKFKPDGSFWNDSFHGEYVTGRDFDGFNALWGAFSSIMTLNSNGFKEWLPKDIGMQRPPEFYSPQFMDIAVDKNENVWATGWYNGTVMYDRTNWHPYYSNDTILPNGDYDRIFTDSKNRVWFGTNQSMPNYGFTLFENYQWKTYYSPQNYWISFIYQIAEDHFGNIWLATGGGLLKYDGNSFTVFDNSNSPLNSNTVYAVTVDLSNNIWVGTESGLYVYNQDKVKLGPFVNQTPVDSFKVSLSGKYASAKVYPKQLTGGTAKYELQRGRSLHKFWTVASSDFINNASLLSIIDSSDIIGNYYYRIKKIEDNGNTTYSSSTYFAGQNKNIEVLYCQTFLSADQIYLKLKIQNEIFVSGFEILSNDTISHYNLNIHVPLTEKKTNDGYYIINLEPLSHSPHKYHYVVNAVFSDSTRMLLRKLDVAGQMPLSFNISHNYPNPFNGTTTFKVSVPNSGRLVFRVYDILGREVLPSIAKDLLEGYIELQLDFKSLASGVYLYSAEMNNQRLVGKMMLLK
jgi:streptogramin lyase